MKIKKIINAIKSKHLISKVSMVKDYIFAAVKIIFGIFAGSYFFSVSGLYSVCTGLAKTSFFDGKEISGQLEPESPEYAANEYKHLTKMAFYILAGSIIYVVYMARLFFFPSNFYYGEVLAIAIAAVSFTELALAIIHLKRAKGVLSSGLRCVNLTSALMAIVLTQVAILSFAHDSDVSFYNAVSGTAIGALCVIVAIIMLIQSYRYNKTSKEIPGTR